MSRRRTHRRHSTRGHGRRTTRRQHRAPAPFGITLGGWLLIVLGAMIIVAQYRHGS